MNRAKEQALQELLSQNQSYNEEIQKRARAIKEAQNSLVKFRAHYFADNADVEPAPFHYDWSNILLHGTKHFAIEAFRESAKTQLVIRANLLHALAFPSVRRQYIVMICSNKWMASNRLKEVSRLIKGDRTGMLTAAIDRYNVDSGDALEVSLRREFVDATGVEAVRIETYGKGSAVRGLVWGAIRPNLVIIDDPQDAADAASEHVMDSDWGWFLSDVVFLGQKTRIFMIGNNLGEKCIIERVFDQSERLGFEVKKVPALDMEKQESNWPAMFTYEELIDEMENYTLMGKKDLWWRERMCKCISPDSQLFKREDFRYYDPKELYTASMRIYMTVDPAASTRESADRTAIIVVGTSPEGHWFVLDMWADREPPSTVMDVIFKMVQKWRPIFVGIESVAYQAALQDFLTKEMPVRNTFFTIQRLRASNKKEIRIQTSLQPRFKAGAIWFPKGTPWVNDLENELMSFPHGLHDDVIDALAYIEQVATSPSASRGYAGSPLFYDFA